MQAAPAECAGTRSGRGAIGANDDPDPAAAPVCAPEQPGKLHPQSGYIAAFDQSHSESYRQKYHPHYRVVSSDFALLLPVLTAIHQAMGQGRKALLVLDGPCGSGKSTLANLICRFYEPTTGTLLIDGRDAKERSQLWLHSSIGYVLQTPHLFSGTIRENLLMGNPDATDEQIMDAIRADGELASRAAQDQLSGSLRTLYLLPDYSKPIYTVQFLLFENLGNSFLIDWQQGECHFEDERFVRFLELTGRDMSNQSAEDLALLDNPAVSLAMFITKKISGMEFLYYVIAQTLGATFGAAVLG